MDIVSDLTALLRDGGACLTGFADLTYLDEKASGGYPRGISIAVPLDSEVIGEISDGPTLRYLAEYRRTNVLLDFLSEGAAGFLRDLGARADTVEATTSAFDAENLSSGLPHKTVATLAGLGWIGKCALLITREYGASIRLGTVLTDADLPVADPVTSSNCGSCTLCVDACPGTAPTGIDWVRGIPREEFFDAHACQDAARLLSEERIGGASTICGICISVCPWANRNPGEP